MYVPALLGLPVKTTRKAQGKVWSIGFKCTFRFSQNYIFISKELLVLFYFFKHVRDF